MLADPQPADLGEGRLADLQRAGAQAAGIGIVKHQDLVVGGQPQVAFDAGAELQRGGEGDQAVFGKRGAMVQPAMREPLSTGIERIRI